MGASASAPSTDYVVHGIRVRVVGRKKTVRHGAAVRVDLELADAPVPLVDRYFRGPQFIRDLNATIMHRDAQLPGQAGLRIPPDVLRDVGWVVNAQRADFNKAKKTVGFTVTITPPLPKSGSAALAHYDVSDACGYMAACVARHVLAGSIPVDTPASLEVDDWAQVTAITFRP